MHRFDPQKENSADHLEKGICDGRNYFFSDVFRLIHISIFFDRYIQGEQDGCFRWSSHVSANCYYFIMRLSGDTDYTDYHAEREKKVCLERITGACKIIFCTMSGDLCSNVKNSGLYSGNRFVPSCCCQQTVLSAEEELWWETGDFN